MGLINVLALERKISVRSTKEDLINRGLLKDLNGTSLPPLPDVDENKPHTNEHHGKMLFLKKIKDHSFQWQCSSLPSIKLCRLLINALEIMVLGFFYIMY